MNCMVKSPLEKAFRTHLFTYRHDGAEWVLAIKATDATDARTRLSRLQYATYNGVALASLPMALGPAGMLVAGARNAATRLFSRFRRTSCGPTATP